MNTTAPNCSCSKLMVYKEGVKNGRKWKGYFCPDRQCSGQPVWLRDDSPPATQSTTPTQNPITVLLRIEELLKQIAKNTAQGTPDIM